MTINPIPALEILQPAGESRGAGSDFHAMLASALGDLSNALGHADALASAVALGSGGIADAAIARAKADVALEIAAVAASRVTGAITTLMQTQI